MPSLDEAARTPTPALRLAEGHAELHVHADHAVLVVQTVIDASAVDQIVADLVEMAPQLPSDGGVDIDLRLAGVLSPNPLRRLVTTICEDLGGRCRLVVDRLSARLLLERWGIADDVAVVTALP